MRVLYLTNSAEIGGGNTSLLTLWPAVMSLGVTPLATCPADGPMVSRTRELGMACAVTAYHELSWRAPVRAARATAWWVRFLREQRVDVIHANGPMAARAVMLAAARLHLPTVCHIHFPERETLVEWAFRRLPKPDAFLFCSHATHQQMASPLAAACPDADQIVVHNPVAAGDFQPPDRRDPGRFRIGIVANLLPVKGHLDLLDMARLLTDRALDAEYWIVGGDIHKTGYGDVLKQRTEALSLNDRVRFLGHRRDVPQIVQQLDLLVCTSHEEPFGIGLLEAMSCERAIVATRVGGIPEVVHEGATALLAPAKEPAALADAVERLWHDDGMRTRFGRAGRQRVLAHFTPEACARKVAGIYSRLLERAHVPA